MIMAQQIRLPKNVNVPVLQHIEALVQRKRSIDYITASVKANFKGILPSTIRNYTEYARALRSSANNFLQSGDRKLLTDLGRSTRSANPEMVRVGYTFQFKAPDAPSSRKRGFSVDLPASLSKKEVMKRIREDITKWVDKN